MRFRNRGLLFLISAGLIVGSCQQGLAQTAATPSMQSTPSSPATSTLTPTGPETVSSLIAKVDREYQAGQANYTAGHLAAAKVNFDNAVDMLLSGPFDVRNDERLQREYDKITEGIQELETQALKEGDGFTEQQAQPAPIDEANEVTFPVDPNVKAKAAAELKSTRSDLPLVMNDYVASYINYFSSPRGHGVLERAWERAGRYRDMISRIFKQEGVPQDLIYLAEAESGFQPLALSRAGARGMWQFMASRATAYGLERNWWVDERQDPEKSTLAAAKHLKDLYREFGDWYLAMAAYNSGPGTVMQGVQRTGYADFWQLYKRNVLPKETKNYVPIILAMTIMAKNPVQYGLQDVQPEPPPSVDTVTVDYPVDLRLVAECIDQPLSTLEDLNPSLLRMTTPKGMDFELHLPAGTKEKYLAAIEAIPIDKRVWWRYQKVQPGDTLASVARKYRTTTSAIADANNLEGKDLQPDAKLIIPVTPGHSVDGSTYSRHPSRYRVRRGDTVLSVADDFGVPPERLRRWNHLKGNTLRRGHVLVVYKPVGEAEETVAKDRRNRNNTKELHSAKARRRVHRVRKGETLSSIAERYNTTVEQLRRDNRLANAELRPGETLIIHTDR